MAHKYPNILIHYVFSTKERRNLIPDTLIPAPQQIFRRHRTKLRNPRACCGRNFQPLHLLIVLPTNVPAAKAIQVLKANSSRWLRDHGIDFAWQEGYGAFSVSSSNRDAVKHYIEHQAEHHRKRTYEREFETLFGNPECAFDPKEAFA